MSQTGSDLLTFRKLILQEGRRLYRDLAWRNISDPYEVWLSEVMLQQTQVSRVDGRWQRWLDRFPTIEVLANAPKVDVLDEWQGLGYNSRALRVQQAAQKIVELGVFPDTVEELKKLPGIGPATAAGICAFAFNKHAMYLETNVRTVFLHELFPDAEGVPDKVLVPLVDETCPQDASVKGDTPRDWYYALLDYGAHLKKTVPNPSRRSKVHTKQSKFEGSHRQKRAELLRIMLEDSTVNTEGLSFDQLQEMLNIIELRAGRSKVSVSEFEMLIDELCREGFIQQRYARYFL